MTKANVERCTEIFYDALQPLPPTFVRPWIALSGVEKAELCRFMVKALAALREPTPEMIAAGRREPEEMRAGSDDCDVNPLRATDRTTARYQAMIDEALKE